MSEPIFDGMSIHEHAGQIAASVRAINHLSIGRAGENSLPYPSDIAVVVAELSRAAHRLRQAAAQLADRIDRLDKAGHLLDADPDPSRPDRASRACALLTVSVAAATARLATALDAAHIHLACLAYEDQPTSSARTVTSDTPPSVAESTELRELGR